MYYLIESILKITYNNKYNKVNASSMDEFACCPQAGVWFARSIWAGEGSLSITVGTQLSIVRCSISSKLTVKHSLLSIIQHGDYSAP